VHFEDAIEKEHRDAVDDKEPERPAPGPCLHCLDVGQGVARIDNSREREEQVPGQEVAWQPAQDGKRLDREGQQWCGLQLAVGSPVATLVARSVFEVIHGGAPVACIGAAVVGQQRKLSAQNLSCKHFLHNAPFLHALRINKHHFCGKIADFRRISSAIW
jgi:hypothetical protein